MEYGYRCIADAHVFLALPSLCQGSHRLNQLLDCLTEMVRSGNLCFPDLVANDCAKYATGEIIHTWIKAVSWSRAYRNFQSDWQDEVLSICPGLDDTDDDLEQTQVHVASMAMMFTSHFGEDVAVATEDRYPLPTRMCLVEACKALELKVIGAAELAVCAGGGEFLRND